MQVSRATHSTNLLHGTGDNYLTYGPSMKSVKKVCAKVKEQTLSIFKPVKNEEVVQRFIASNGDSRHLTAEFRFN